MRQVFKVDYLSSLIFSVFLLLAIFTRIADITSASLIKKAQSLNKGSVFD